MPSATACEVLQTDSIGYEDQINRYAYVGNDPVNGIDPDGLQVQAICLAAGPMAPACASVVSVVQWIAIGVGAIILTNESADQGWTEADYNEKGQEVLEEIIKDASKVEVYSRDWIQITNSQGRTALWNADGSFQGFREPDDKII